MGSVNYVNSKTDRTVKIFDDFYSFEMSVESMDYDAVYSYFKSVYSGQVSEVGVDVAGNFTVTLFRIANEQKIPVLTLLDQLKTATEGSELNITLAYYLNNMRSASTLLGIAQPIQSNFYAARNVRP